MSTLKTGALRGTSGTADSVQLHASDQSVTFPGAVTVTGALTSSTTALGGIAEFDQWRVTSNKSGDFDPLTEADLERVDTDGFAAKGSGMSVSSGIWSFPSTGWWLCDFTFYFYSNASTDGNMYAKMMVTTDNSNYNNRLEVVMFAAANDHGVSANGKMILDVTNVSNVKFKITTDFANNSDMFQGHTDFNKSHFTFLKLAET